MQFWISLYTIRLLLFLCPMAVLCSEDCRKNVNSWLQSFTPQFNNSISELTFDWSHLEERLSVCPFEHYQVELWVVRKFNEKDFGSVNYWSRYERCTKLAPEDFEFHSLISREIGSLHSVDNSVFRHIAERNYIIRICHCSPDSFGRAPCSRACFSLTSSFCSRLIVSPIQGLSLVSPWCKKGSKKEGYILFNHAEEHNCTSLKISGEVQTCTPVQEYDLVEVTFRPVHSSSMNCSLTNPALSNSSKALVPLIRSIKKEEYSEYMGYFTHYFDNLSTDFKYCVHLEIKNNPYCRHEYVINHFQGAPSVCNKYLNLPLLLSGRKCVSGIWVKKDQYMKVITVTLSFLIISMIVGAIIIFFRTKYVKRIFSHRRKKFRRWPFYDPPSLTNGINISHSDAKYDILLIYFDDSREALVRNCCLKKWIKSLKVNVLDFNDDEIFEEMGCYSETWLETLINRKETKVIIAHASNLPIIYRTNKDSEEGAKNSSFEYTNSNEKEEGDSFLYEDNVFDLKLSAINYIKTNYCVNYEKISVINYATTPKDVVIVGSSITPGRTIVLPDHFNALRKWILTEDGRLPRMSSLTYSLEQEFNTLAT